MSIPLVDLKAQYQPLKAEILSRVAEVLDGMQLYLGPNVQALEREFAACAGVPYAVGVSDGTTALQLALMACGVGEGDEVITAAHTFIATAEAIVLVGATPVFVDIDPHTYTIDAARIGERVTPRTRAVIPVHLYGHPADMDPIMHLAARHGLWVIEDACQAHGAHYKGRPAGGLGHMAAFSFYCSKNLGAYGEGGMLTTADPELARRAHMLRTHGSSERYLHELVGLNGRLDEIQASILRVKLPYLQLWNDQRRRNAAHYTELLSDLEWVVTPRAADYAGHVYHLYVVRVPQRDGLLAYLREGGVGAAVHYPVPCHLQPALRGLGYGRGDLPVTEQVAEEVISLPMYPELSEEQRLRVVELIRAFFQGKA
ncbi:MAG: DegT/DnrJ/EryC1/StrS family aminotransferase [Anaerolineae bacterium]|nr:DegT/DnrJ/EryC1/StrS family aminotransferase [Anaerolineae bacterium]